MTQRQTRSCGRIVDAAAGVQLTSHCQLAPHRYHNCHDPSLPAMPVHTIILWPLYNTICWLAFPAKNWRILLEHNFATHALMLTATSAF